MLLFASSAWAAKPGLDESERHWADKAVFGPDSPSPRAAKSGNAGDTDEAEAEDNPYGEQEEVALAEAPARSRRRKKRASPAPEQNDLSGLECSPAVNEVELRRPIPVSCSTAREDVSRVEIRYKAPGKRRYTRLRLKKRGTEWTGTIPCTATARRGTLKLSFRGRNDAREIVAKINTVSIRLVEQTDEPPPSLPGESAPARCYDSAECPPEFMGSPTCPGTKAGETSKSSSTRKKGWGGTCEESSECRSGFACIDGSCEQPPKCESNADCPRNGECSDGVCEFPDADEVAGRFKPKSHWFGAHYGVDLAFGSATKGACREGNADYACYLDGEPYKGPANDLRAGDTPGGLQIASHRVLLSYEYWFGRFAAGARVGFSFGGRPGSLLHLEGRFLFSLLGRPLVRPFRPYIGVAGGLARTDPGARVNLIDCGNPDYVTNTEACKDSPWDPRGVGPQGQMPVADAKESVEWVDAYKKGSSAFVGPTVGFIWALSDGFALQLNVNAMFPNVVFEPSAGLIFGL